MNPNRDIWDFLEEEQPPLQETPSSNQTTQPTKD
tara:strand:+ start:393 stop:494 length:102 start_codon:yes stop_codon:yes gene_type:complete